MLCRLAALAQNLKKAEGPRKLYVGSLHYNITDAMLKAIFEPFGHVEKLAIQKDENGHSKGFGFVEVHMYSVCVLYGIFMVICTCALSCVFVHIFNAVCTYSPCSSGTLSRVSVP